MLVDSSDQREAIKLYYRNEFGGEFEISETRLMYPDMGDDTIMAFAKTINLFMRHIGYSFDKDYVFMESVTEDEYEQLQWYLNELRSEKDAESEDE